MFMSFLLGELEASVWPALSLSLSFCFSLFLSLSVSHSLFLFLSLCVFLSVSLSLCLSLFLSVSLSLSLSLFLCLSLSLSLSHTEMCSTASWKMCTPAVADRRTWRVQRWESSSCGPHGLLSMEALRRPWWERRTTRPWVGSLWPCPWLPLLEDSPKPSSRDSFRYTRGMSSTTPTRLPTACWHRWWPSLAAVHLWSTLPSRSSLEVGEPWALSPQAGVC